MHGCVTAVEANATKTSAASTAHLQLRPAACSGGISSTESGCEAAQLQVHTAARKHQKFGCGFGSYGTKYHKHVVESTKALQSWRLRLLRSVANICRENAVDWKPLQEWVRNGFTHIEAEAQRLALPAAECDFATAVL